MRLSPLTTGIIYIALGIVFTVIAIYDVRINGEWGILTYVFAIFATFDFGGGIKLIMLHVKIKNFQKNIKDDG